MPKTGTFPRRCFARPELMGERRRRKGEHGFENLGAAAASMANGPCRRKRFRAGFRSSGNGQFRSGQAGSRRQHQHRKIRNWSFRRKPLCALSCPAMRTSSRVVRGTHVGFVQAEPKRSPCSWVRCGIAEGTCDSELDTLSRGSSRTIVFNGAAPPA